MTRNTKFFLAACLASVVLLLIATSVGSLFHELFFWQELTKLSDSAAASVLQNQLQEARPTLKPGVVIPTIKAKAALSFLVTPEAAERILLDQGAGLRLPIASLTKLMTAHVALESYDAEEIVIVSARAIAQEGPQGWLQQGQKITVKDLLYPLLLESSNDAAAALAEHGTAEVFMRRMNRQATILGLSSTSFVNSTGLDPEDPEGELNMSSAYDLAQLVIAIKEKHPEVFDILSLPAFGPYTNTNQFLRANGWHTKVLGGKTGWTDRAQGCLILLLQSPKNKGYTIYVILGAEDRFEEMRKLVDWTQEAYIW